LRFAIEQRMKTAHLHRVPTKAETSDRNTVSA